VRYRIRFHPAVADDLDAIAIWIMEFAGPGAAYRMLTEIEATVSGLASLPHRGSRRDEIAPNLRAIPAGRKGVVAFTVDDATQEVLIISVTYGGADWIGISKSRN
jgi:toxin ParE1/3/4